MPQMAPMNWLILFSMFVIAFMLFNILNYYCFTYTPKSNIMKKKSLNIYWKW